jgi:hypothetical protein
MKVKELIKELIDCDMEDDVTVCMSMTPDGGSYTAHINYIDTLDTPCICMHPHEFHAHTDENQNPIPTTLENTLCGVMGSPADDGSYKEHCDDFVKDVGVVFDSKLKKKVGKKNEK